MVEALWSMAQGHPYLVLFPLVVLEGPIATVVAGSMVAAGAMTLPWAGALVVAAELTADTAIFTVGRLARHGRVGALAARLGLTPARRAPLEAALARNLPAVLAGAKVADAAAVPVILAAGASGVGYGRFIGWNLLLSAVKAGVLLTAGVVFGTRLAGALTPTAAVVLVAGVVAASTTVRALRQRRPGLRPTEPQPAPAREPARAPVPTPAGAP